MSILLLNYDTFWIMQTKITYLIISLIFAVILGYMASVATLMIIPITGYILLAIAQIMDNNFDITIRILCWVYTVLISYYFYKLCNSLNTTQTYTNGNERK